MLKTFAAAFVAAPAFAVSLTIPIRYASDEYSVIFDIVIGSTDVTDTDLGLNL
jgi:hypothetical protein